MKDELIAFTTAKLVKEKGFKEPCVYYFFQCEEDPVEEKGSILDGRADWGELDFLDNRHWSRPTQSLLSRWLREVHNVAVTIHPVWDFVEECVCKDQWEWEVNDMVSGRRGIQDPGTGIFPTYEECLEQGLLQALTTLP